jgi:serine/threonine protein kinase
MSKSSDKDSVFGLSSEQLERLLTIGYGKDRDVEELSSSIDASDRELPMNAAEGSESILQIDGYEVIEKVAEAGQGQVWRALQQSTDRQVAIKVPRLGSVTSERARIRFEREVGLAARLKHPNIARIYDSGVNRGQYYYVMDFVEGLNLDEYVRQQNLTHRQVLELMRTICQAVQHAHQKGVIHRDLKPSNIIVTNEGRPFIVDFGLAKGFLEDDQNLVLSVDGETVGTPAYMSPEQAAGHSDKVDTRTDVYSLGVTLFTLLTGSNPHDLSGTRLEVMHRIAEQEVMRPRTLNRNIDKDIEALLLKALDKDPDRRYSSAAGLTEDINNYLKGEPLIAGSQSNVYRLKKFVKRNWFVLTSIAAVLAVLIIGVIVSTVFAIGQARARSETEQQARDAQAVNDFLSNGLFWIVSPFRAWGPDATIGSFLDAISENLQGKFDDRPLIEASIRHSLGTIYQSLTEYKTAEPHFKRALDIRREQLGSKHSLTLDSMLSLAWLCWQQARYDEAEPLAFDAVQCRRYALGDEQADTLTAMIVLGWVYWGQGDYDKAESLFVPALETSRRVLGPEHRWTLAYMSHLGTLCTNQGRFEEAEQLLKEANENMPREWGAEHLHTTLTKRRLGGLYLVQGRYDEAEPLLEEAEQVDRRLLGERHPYTMASMSILGRLYVAQGRYGEAEPLLRRALDTGREVLGEDHHYILWFGNALAQLYSKQKRYDKAEDLLLKSVDIGHHTLGENHPETLQSLNALINLYEAWNKPEKANRWREKQRLKMED